MSPLKGTKSFGESFSGGVYLGKHISEIIHGWPIELKFHMETSRR